MHVLIYALVEVDSNDDHPEDAALGAGKSVFDELVGVGVHNDQIFDYYTTFDDDSSSVSGPARYGERPPALSLDFPRGKRWMHLGWKRTKQQFERNIERVREGFEEHSNEEIREENADATMIRHYMKQLGEYRGPSIRLYTENGEGVRTRRHLDRVLDKSENLWIVPADVHY